MKKLIFLFAFAFAFVGGQAFSQMYIVTLTKCNATHLSNCNPTVITYLNVLTKIDPTGNVTYTCIDNRFTISQDPSALITLNQELNSIISQGYKLV